MRIDLLCSGSKGNSCLVRSGSTAVLIDCGSTKRYLTGALSDVDQSIGTLDALLVTHGHTDHISQLKLFNGLPVYSYCELETDNHRVVFPQEAFTIGDLHVQVIGLSHDAPHTVGYVLQDAHEKLVYITDTGYLPNDEKQFLTNADHYIFESNHDMKMLMNTRRPMFVKQRILSDSGHLSNPDSSNHLTGLINARTKSIILAHLSQEANHPQLALDQLYDTFSRKNLKTGSLRIQAAGQFEKITIND